MPDSNIILSFNIDAWLAHSDGISQPSDWQQWSKTLAWPVDGKAPVNAIPPMMRRRMSSLSKLAVQTSIELLEQHEVDYLVFASRHGELTRSAQLIQDVVAGEEASPMAFSQSVHNTAAGLATIATKKPIPLTSIAAGDNTFQSALLEAWVYLKSNPEHKVMLVDFDEPLPEVYNQYEEFEYRGYALGLILSAGDEIRVAGQSGSDFKPQFPQALDFIRHYVSDESSWQTHSRTQSWVWQR
ncbi:MULTISPECIES: beta-ketoacyl synthase chain length factor [Vibrio]|uniref:3-oxoacyl-ACP synthase n=1 Tax=Photobacterium sp. (strain ATCC 43367) TaxID=379097 RepID=A0A0A5HZN5_PHOS4|nr:MULTISPECIES: beta-ketoacyl synthase chain length factor [Vibrio]EED26019.1 beta-ketoacyl synthase domain protein [Vibrio sp. 16]KGY09785.1 3-oxoacyl-ACP synthase [Vibrio sinaloensis]KIE22492.1 3-oxoacyl-ACP synthase [Vibrio sinaloensis]CAK4074552.1 hypothetical protein VDT1_3466 [Vibrio sp. 16]